MNKTRNMNDQFQFARLKRLSALLLAIFLLAMLGACSGQTNQSASNGNEAASTAQQNTEQPANSTANNSNTQSNEAAEAQAEFKTVTTSNGEIEIPVNPQRIVAEEYLGSLIALGVTPVGAPGLTLENMYFKEALSGVADTGTYGQMSPEKIISLQPDLIISGVAENYEALSKIAPTVTIPYGELKNATEELTYFGKLLGKEQEAQQWLANYEQEIADAKQKVDAAIPQDASFSIIERTSDAMYVYGDNFGRGGQAVYQALGRKPPAGIADQLMEKQWAELSEETLPQYAGDYIILTSNVHTLEDLKNDPLWSSLPAVQQNHVYVWKEERSWYYDPIAILSQTKELAAWLTGD